MRPLLHVKWAQVQPCTTKYSGKKTTDMPYMTRLARTGYTSAWHDSLYSTDFHRLDGLERNTSILPA